MIQSAQETESDAGQKQKLNNKEYLDGRFPLFHSIFANSDIKFKTKINSFNEFLKSCVSVLQISYSLEFARESNVEKTLYKVHK